MTCELDLRTLEPLGAVDLLGTIEPLESTAADRHPDVGVGLAPEATDRFLKRATMTVISSYILTLVLAAYMVVLGLNRAGTELPEESMFDRLAGWSAVVLFWTATLVYIALCLSSGSYEFIPAMLILALSLTFLHRPRRAK